MSNAKDIIVKTKGKGMISRYTMMDTKMSTFATMIKLVLLVLFAPSAARPRVPTSSVPAPSFVKKPCYKAYCQGVKEMPEAPSRQLGRHLFPLLGNGIEGEAADDESGFSVSLSDDGRIIAIGAPFNDGSGEDSGHVRVYGYNNGTGWSQLGGDIDGKAAFEWSGFSVSLSADGRTVAIGAPHDDGNGFDGGHVRVFGYNNEFGWSQLGGDIVGEAAGDRSGRSVSLSDGGRIVAIGAPFNDGNGEDSGHVRVYGYNNGTGWSQLGGDIDGKAAFEWSGFSVSLSADGRTVAIGAPYNDGNGEDSGQVRVYDYNNETGWTHLGDNIDGEAAQDLFGFSVSLSADGRTVAIGAPLNYGNGYFSGHVRALTYNNVTGWTQLGDDIDGQAAGVQSGSSVSLSADGRTVGIGGNDGSLSGHVRVFAYNDQIGWSQVGDTINGRAAGDQSGFSVSFSASGRTMAIGAPFNDGNGKDSGLVRVFKSMILEDIPTPAPTPGVPEDIPTPGPTPGEFSVPSSLPSGEGYYYTIFPSGGRVTTFPTFPETYPYTTNPTGGGTTLPTSEEGYSSQPSSVISPPATIPPKPTVAPSAPPSSAPTYEPSPIPINVPSPAPTPPGSPVQAEFVGITLRTINGETLEQEEIEAFERITKVWFEGFFQEKTGQTDLQVGLLAVGVLQMTTNITVTDQFFIRADPFRSRLFHVNIITYSQIINYVSLEKAKQPEEYVRLPFFDLDQNKELATDLSSEILALRFVSSPILPPDLLEPTTTTEMPASEPSRMPSDAPSTPASDAPSTPPTQMPYPEPVPVSSDGLSAGAKTGIGVAAAAFCAIAAFGGAMKWRKASHRETGDEGNIDIDSPLVATPLQGSEPARGGGGPLHSAGSGEFRPSYKDSGRTVLGESQGPVFAEAELIVDENP